VIIEGPHLQGRTLNSMRFADRYGLITLAIHRAGKLVEKFYDEIGGISLRASMSYATPMAYKTNLLIMNAGKYTFNDFVRIGVPLIVLMWATLSWLLPTLYGIE
jgi:hypothetical protein